MDSESYCRMETLDFCKSNINGTYQARGFRECTGYNPFEEVLDGVKWKDASDFWNVYNKETRESETNRITVFAFGEDGTINDKVLWKI